jgi:hypothetical protein
MNPVKDLSKLRCIFNTEWKQSGQQLWKPVAGIIHIKKQLKFHLNRADRGHLHVHKFNKK